MRVKDVMTDKCSFVSPETNLQEAARKMRDLDCGFLPIGNESRGKLEGVITDRDIVIRAIAEGADPVEAKVEDWETQRVLYCFEDDDLKSAADSMHDQQVHRLIVLNNPEEKQLCGVISLGDIARHKEEHAAADALEGIASKSA